MHSLIFGIEITKAPVKFNYYFRFSAIFNTADRNRPHFFKGQKYLDFKHYFDNLMKLFSSNQRIFSRILSFRAGLVITF